MSGGDGNGFNVGGGGTRTPGSDSRDDHRRSPMVLVMRVWVRVVTSRSSSRSSRKRSGRSRRGSQSGSGRIEMRSRELSGIRVARGRTSSGSA